MSRLPGKPSLEDPADGEARGMMRLLANERRDESRGDWMSQVVALLRDAAFDRSTILSNQAPYTDAVTEHGESRSWLTVR